MFESVNTLYIENVSIEKDYNLNSEVPTSYIMMYGTFYYSVPQWEGYGASFTFECKGYSRHLSKDLFVTDAINDALRNFFNGIYIETDFSTTGWPGELKIEKRVHKVKTDLIEDYDLFIKDLFSKDFIDTDLKPRVSREN